MAKRTILSIALLILSSSFLRFYKISELTEFLGDQGRTGIVIYEAWVNKTIPLAGPTVLSGQHLGPFFYYLMAPSFILSNFNPLGPAVFTALLGILTVLLMYYLSNKLFGFRIGFFIGLLYAVSPLIVAQDRILWEPNVIPLFLLLFIISLYKIREQKDFRYFLLLGVIVGILIQLHYPNVFFMFLSMLFVGYLLFCSRKIESMKTTLWSLGGLLSFILVLLPFFIFETQHDFIDLKEIALIFLGVSSTPATSQPIYMNALDMSSRLFKHIILLQQSWQFTILQLFVIIIPFIKRNFWHVFFTLWFITGVFAISLYKGVIFDHYLMFLLPIPFLLFGFFLQVVEKYISYKILIILLLALVFLHLTRTDIFSTGNNDVYRTQLINNAIIELALPTGRQSNNESFSFTLISSRSFSDLHYRYFFKLKGVEPLKITRDDYSLLFLVCEKSPCPTKEEMKRSQEIQALCYDPHCKGEYPKVNLKEFSLIKIQDTLDGRVFTYRRK